MVGGRKYWCEELSLEKINITEYFVFFYAIDELITVLVDGFVLINKITPKL